MTMLPTLTVSFKIVIGESESDWGEVVHEYGDATAVGCLVRPGVASGMDAELSQHQDTSVTVHLPKDFLKDVRNGYFQLYGETFRVESVSLPVTASPLRWNRRAEATIDSTAARLFEGDQT